MRYQVIIEVEVKAESDDFKHWLQRYSNEIIAISENGGCGCCVDIYTIEATENAEPLATFNSIDSHQVDSHEAVALYEGLEKNRIINDYLNYP